MLIAKKIHELQFYQLMKVYEESNRENAARFYPHIDRNAAMICAEQDFYAYLNDCFFQTDGAFYCVLTVRDRYVSALRMEPYKDGYLLEALETAPMYRNKGFAKRLVALALDLVDKPIYSHVSKANDRSLAVHLGAGFVIISECAEYIDGSTTDDSFTLRYGK